MDALPSFDIFLYHRYVFEEHLPSAALESGNEGELWEATDLGPNCAV